MSAATASNPSTRWRTASRAVGADILKLRRHPSTMAGALGLSVGLTTVYTVAIVTRAEGSLTGTRIITTGATFIALYFGAFAAMLIGATAGTIDHSHGVLPDLAATGWPRHRLVWARLASALVVAVSVNLAALTPVVIGAVAAGAGAGSSAAASTGAALTAGFIAASAAWVVVSTVVVTAVAAGLASATGSRSLTLTALIGWHTAGTTLLYGAPGLGVLRQGLLGVALTHLRPGLEFGSRTQPGSTSGLPGFVLPMSTPTAWVVLAAWAAIPMAIAAWRIRAKDIS